MATNKNAAAKAANPETVITDVIAPDANVPDTATAANPAMGATVDNAQIREEAAAAANSIRQEERVEIFIERASGNDEPNLFVSVNGYNCLLPKGKTSLVPKSVADEINRARRAQQKLDATIDALKEAANQKPE